MYFRITNEKDTQENRLKDLRNRKKYNLIDNELYLKALKFIESDIRFRYLVKNEKAISLEILSNN